MTPAFPRKAPVARLHPSRAHAVAGAFRHRYVRHSPEAVFGVSGIDPRASCSGVDLATPEGRKTLVGNDDWRRGRRHRRRYRCKGLFGVRQVVREEEEKDRNWRGGTRPEGNRGYVTREGGGGMNRSVFVRAVVGGLVAGPVVGFGSGGKGVLVAKAVRGHLKMFGILESLEAPRHVTALAKKIFIRIRDLINFFSPNSGHNEAFSARGCDRLALGFLPYQIMDME